MHIGKNFSSWWVMLCPFQLNRSTQFPVNAVQSLLFEEATNRVNCVALTPFHVKVNLCLNIFKLAKVKAKHFFTKQLASINFVLISLGKTKFSMASCYYYNFGTEQILVCTRLIFHRPLSPSNSSEQDALVAA